MKGLEKLTEDSQNVFHSTCHAYKQHGDIIIKIMRTHMKVLLLECVLHATYMDDEQLKRLHEHVRDRKRTVDLVSAWARKYEKAKSNNNP